MSKQKHNQHHAKTKLYTAV